MSTWIITRKDLSLLLRDRRTFAILLLLPLTFIFIIGMTTGQLLGWKNSNQRLKIAIVDKTDYAGIGSASFMNSADDANTGDDSSEPPLSEAEQARQRRVARHLVADTFNGIQRTAGVEIRLLEDWAGRPVPENSRAQIGRELLDDGKINALLVFEPEFYQRIYFLDPAASPSDGSERISAHRLESLGIRLNTRHEGSSAASAVAAIVGLNVLDVVRPVVTCRSLGATVAERRSPRYRAYCGPVDEMARTPPDDLLPPIAGDDDTGGRSVYDALVPSYTVMFVFFLVNIMARSFLAERELGTLRRLRIAPISGASILLGKTLPFLLVSLVQTAVLFIAGRLLFQMSWGTNPAMLLPVIFATSLAATALGLLIATLVKSDAQVSAYATTAVIVLAGISGCFMPRDWLPELMRQISLATPHAWALIAYDELLNTTAPDLAQVWQCAGMLCLFSAAFLIAGAWRFGTAD